MASTTSGTVLASVTLPMLRGASGTAGGGLSAMVTLVVSVALDVPSWTVSVKVMVMSESTWGTVNEVDREATSDRTIVRSESCDHR